MRVQRLSGPVLATCLFAAGLPAAAQDLTPDEAKSIAMDGYVYGYSLITTEVTRIQMTNVPSPTHDLHAPMGMFSNVLKYPPADYRGVSAPNADTLYSFAWLDLSEPQVLTQPDMGSRYFILEGVDLWMTDLADSPGSRTYGGDVANFLLTGPGWNGTVPEGMHHIPMATRYMVVAGRIYSDGTEQDYAIVNGLQEKLKVTPLSAWGSNYTPQAAPVNPDPGFSMTDKPQQVILGMSTADYFSMMADLMCEAAPPAQEDGPILARMAEIGIEPCKPFDMSGLDSTAQDALKDVPKEALARIEANYRTLGEKVNGWNVVMGVGAYGTDYLKRATVAAFGWPANRQQDAVYPYTDVDGDGDKLSGANKYTLTFAKGEEPPVRGFWSITMYEIDNGWWFYPNDLSKFTVSPRNDPKANADGSVTLYFQNESPGEDKQANWLPAPKGDFLLMLRMYWPQEADPSILDGSWKPTAVTKVN